MRGVGRGPARRTAHRRERQRPGLGLLRLDAHARPGGSFEISGVPEGTLTLRANAGDFLTSSRSASTTVTIGPGQAEATAEIRFEQGFRVDGRVTRGGRPVPDAMVMAFPDGGNRRSASGRTDEAGGYVIEGLDEGRYTFTAKSEAGAPIRRASSSAATRRVDLEAPPARLAAPWSRRSRGARSARWACASRRTAGGMRFASMASTDSSGRFAFEDMEPKRYRVTFQKPAYQVETRELTAAEDSDLRVELKRGRGDRHRGEGRDLRDAAARAVRARRRRRRAPRRSPAASRSTARGEARCRRCGPGPTRCGRSLRATRPSACPVSPCRRARSACCSRPAARSRSRPGPRRSRCRRRPAV